MKIKNISCTQFAGIRDADIALDDGINIIYGKNESGKSTLVNLISRVLFQNAKLDGRSNKDFFDLYFPSALKDGSAAGDFADGKLSFETDGGMYTISKEWGADARCTLSTPSGSIRSQEQIDEILREALIYGEGVYSDMLFPSQRNAGASLEAILDASKNTDAKQEINNAVTMAFAESGGVSVDAIEQAIEGKIREIEGLHWDAERNMPKKKSGRWARDLGEILKAYYDLSDAQEVLDNIAALEAEADRTSAEYNEKNDEACSAEKEFDTFNKYARRLAEDSEQREKIKRLNNAIKKQSEILGEWPKLLADLESAKKLYAEKTDRTILDKYNAAKKLADGINEYKERLNGMSCPSDDEIMTVRSETKRYSSLENKLCGMNLTAQIKLFGTNTVVVKSLRTGETLTLDDNLAITEAVSITVPDVMEMRLAPADVDAEEIKKQLELSMAAVNKIYGKYGVKSVDELENKSRLYRDMCTKIENAENRLSMLLDGDTLDELYARAKNISSDIREMSQIDGDISRLCANTEITRFITQKETQIKLYEKDYVSIDAIKEEIRLSNAELDKIKETVKETGDIPEEYQRISNPDAHLKMLKNAADNAQKLRENALSDKAAASGRLEAYKESLDDDPANKAQEAKCRFEEQKELLAHWKHIEEVFKQKKDELSDNPMQDIAERFTHYLSEISGGRVSSEFTEQDKLSMNIYSSNRILDYGKLSEGTKETVFLAFRLAALDHLFPNGGVVVLDDPFTDMDDERTAQSCALIKEFAKRHQVIFLTCKEEYLELLDGKTIRI